MSLLAASLGSPASSFDSQWDLFEDPSQEHTQADNGWDIEYSTEWNLTVNNEAIMPKITEPEQDALPADFWEHSLEPKLANFLRKKNRPLRTESTTVVVSVTARATPAITQTIDWIVIHKHLIKCGELFRAGKKLKLSFSFNYIDIPQSSTTSSQRAKRGPLSRAQRMLDERDEQKAYKLLGPHIEILVEYKQQGHILTSHEDVPNDVRQQLFNEEKESLERHKKPTTSAASVPRIPITIIVLPIPGGIPAADVPSESSLIDRLNIPGQLGDQVEGYSAWHESRVKTPRWKADCQKARDAIIKHSVDLNQICCDRDYQFLIDVGVLKGTAKRFASDIDYWFETTKRCRVEE
ncbi:hypothetical protein EG329_004547 [Mollisiaceae sp. DMI_Dod_QoI]|nr:hypothetical protein EG329_004547 [Helotiales sp. DMI_Dod_QoI]